MKTILFDICVGLFIILFGVVFSLSAKWVILLELVWAFVLWVIKTM